MTLVIGRFSCSFPSDGRVGPIPAENVIVDATLAAERNVFETPMYVPVLVDGDEVVLIDAGWGQGETSGRLPDELRALGIEPEQVTRILVTHMHGDHVGGLLTHGAPTFPNARVHIPKEDVDWVRETGRGETGLLDALASAGLLADLGDLPDGIEAIETPGHTPGHTVYRVSGAEGALLIGGDVILLEEQIADPSIAVRLDNDAAGAEASRRRFLELAATTSSKVTLYHLDPPVARIEADGASWNWIG